MYGELIFQAIACEVEYVIEAEREGYTDWTRIEYAMDHSNFTPWGYAFEKGQKVARWARLRVADKLAWNCNRNSYDCPRFVEE